MSISSQDSTINNLTSRGESYAIGNGFGLTAGHVLFNVKFKQTKITINGSQIPQMTFSASVASGYSAVTYMNNSYQATINQIAAEFVDYYNKWYINYYAWVASYNSWSSGGSIGPAPILTAPLGHPPYTQAIPAAGAITPQQAANSLLAPPNEGEVLNDPRAKAVDSVLAKKSGYKASQNDPGLVLFYNSSDFVSASTILSGSSEHFEIGDSAIGQNNNGLVYPSPGSKNQLGGSIYSSNGSRFFWSKNAFPSNSGSGGLIAWGNHNYVFGNLVATPAKSQELPDGSTAVLQGPGAHAIGINFTPGDFITINNLLESGSTDPGRDPRNLIVGVNSSNSSWQVSGGGQTYSYALGTTRRDVFVGTGGDEAFYASAGDTVDVGSGSNFVSFNPKDDGLLKSNSDMTVDFGRASSGSASGNTVVEVDTSGSQYHYILDLSSDPSITPGNIDLIAGGQSLYWYPGVPGGQLASPGSDPAQNAQWLANAHVEFLSVVDGGSTITFVDQKTKVGIQTSAHEGLLGNEAASPITEIIFSNGTAGQKGTVWSTSDIYDHIQNTATTTGGQKGIDFVNGYNVSASQNIGGQAFSQFFTAYPLNSAGQSSIQTATPTRAVVDASTPQVTQYASAAPSIVVTGQPGNGEPGTLYATTTGQTLDSGGAYSSVHGDGGGDTFIYNQGYGAVTIEETDTATEPGNILKLGAGLSAAGASVTADDSGDIILDFGNSDSVTLAGGLLSSNDMYYGVQQVQFADGTVWSYADLLIKLKTPSSGDAVIYGDATNNVLDGGGVSQTLEGFGGGDTFVFNKGYGALAIEEKAATGSAANVLKLGTGLTAANMTVTADLDGTLTLDFGKGDQVWLENQLNSSAATTYGVQQIQFADGTVWTEADLIARLDTVNASSATLYGDNMGHTFDPEGVDDAVVSHGGGDTFVYQLGYGSLTITESDESTGPDNMLQLGTGITAAGTTVTGDASGDLILNFGGGDSVTLTGALESGGGTTYGVQTVQFADGTVWNFADLMAAADTPSSTNTTLYAGPGSYVLDGQGIANTLVAAGGGDTFVYDQGYGALTISEFDTAANPNNVLQVGAGLSASSLTVTGNANGDMILSFGSADSITLTDGLMSGDGTAYGLQEVVFADGTRLSYGDLLALAETASTTQTTLYGDTGINVLDGNGVAHTLVGEGGNTTFVYGQGYGALTIDATDMTAPTPDNVLQLGSGLTSGNMTVTADASGALILNFGNGDAVTITNALNGSNSVEYGVQQVNFADGSSLTYSQLLGLADTASASNRTLFGDTGANTLDGEGIAHTLVGNGGGDTFNFNQGYGVLTVTENDPDFGDTNILQLGSGITGANTQVFADASGDLILNFGNGDAVTIQGALNTATSTMNGIQQVNFADGTSWTYAQMLALANTGTASSTTLYGDGQGDTFNPDGFARVINSTGNGDIINYAQGDGALTINEADTSGEADNSLVLGAGLLESETVVSTDANNNIILSFGNGDTVTLASAMVQSGTTAYGVQNIQFADGTIWSLADLRYQIDPTSAGMAVVDGDFAETVNADLLDGGGWASGSFDFTDSDINDFHDVSVDSVAVSGTVDPSLTDAQLLALLQANVGSDTSGSDSGSVTWAFSGAGLFDYLQADQSVTLDYVVSVSDGQGGELKQNVSVTVTASQSAGSQLTLYGSGVTINYGLGRGDLYVNDIAGAINPNNTLAFGTGIDPSMITLKVLTDPEATAGDLLDSLQLVVAGAGTITLADALSDPTAGVQTVTFADGTVWTYAQMIAMLGIQDPQQYGEAVAVGGTSADTLDPQGTAHIAQGNGGGDTFVYNRGYGSLDIIEVDHTSDINTLAFGAGIAPADVTVTMSDIDQFKLSLGNGDVVTFEGSGGGISDNSYWDPNAHLSVAVSNAYTGIERVTFADGTVWSIAQLIEQQTADSSGTLYGTEGSGIFDPAGTASTIVSEGTGDQIQYNLGDGLLTIIENPSSSNPENTLAFGAGITASMLTVTTDQTNFYISLNGNDQITINNEYGGGAIQNFTFQDGTTLDYAGLMALTGDYYYSEGDGAVTINAANAPASGNILQVYANDWYSINDTPGSVNYAINANGDLNINFGNGDDLNILHEFNSDGSIATDGIQTIDGFSSAQLTNFWDEARHFNAASGQANLDGDGNGGIFDPKGSANEISDTGSNVDTIVYDRGYGPLAINELSDSYSNSILFGPGISLSSLSFTANADGDLIISLGGSDQVTIKNGLWLETPTDANPVQNLVFQDGTTAYPYQGTVFNSDGSTASIDVSALANVTLTGDSSAQFFEPQGLVHSIVGGGGADQIYYEKGDGQLTIDEEDASGTSSSLLRVFDAGLSLSGASSANPDLGSVVGVTSNDSGDVTLYFGGGDDVTILGQLATSTGTADGVSEITAFDAAGDTDTWTNTDIQAALAYEATTGTVPNAPAPDAASRYKSDYGTAPLQDIVGTEGGAITGNSAPAELDASAGDETVTAGSAGDLLVGGPGDTLNGGAGADRFAFRSGFGQETINNFDPTSAQHDVLQFDGDVFSDWAHLLGATQQQGSDLLITLDPNDTITLKNVPLSSFTSSDARFV